MTRLDWLFDGKANLCVLYAAVRNSSEKEREMITIFQCVLCIVMVMCTYLSRIPHEEE